MCYMSQDFNFIFSSSSFSSLACSIFWYFYTHQWLKRALDNKWFLKLTFVWFLTIYILTYLVLISAHTLHIFSHFIFYFFFLCVTCFEFQNSHNKFVETAIIDIKIVRCAFVFFFPNCRKQKKELQWTLIVHRKLILNTLSLFSAYMHIQRCERNFLKNIKKKNSVIWVI